ARWVVRSWPPFHTRCPGMPYRHSGAVSAVPHREGAPTMSTHTSSPGPGASASEGGRTSIVKVVFASLIGTAGEVFHFFLSGSPAALVFGTLFFPKSDPVTATLLAFGTYALGFAARPLG